MAQPSLTKDKEGEAQPGLMLVPVVGKWLRRGKPKPGLQSAEQAGSQGLQRALPDCSSGLVPWEIKTPLQTAFLWARPAMFMEFHCGALKMP